MQALINTIIIIVLMCAYQVSTAELINDNTNKIIHSCGVNNAKEN